MEEQENISDVESIPPVTSALTSLEEPDRALIEGLIAIVDAKIAKAAKPPVSYEKRLRKMSNLELLQESKRLQKVSKLLRQIEPGGRGMNYGPQTHTDLHTQATGIVLDAVLAAFAKGRSCYPGDKKR